MVLGISQLEVIFMVVQLIDINPMDRVTSMSAMQIVAQNQAWISATDSPFNPRSRT